MHAFSTDGRTNFFKEEVGGARQLRPDLLEIVPLRDGRPVAVARLLRELDTVRVVHAEAPDGRSFVLDEVIVVNEKPSPALHRCSDAESLRMIEALSTGL